jgi:hypothetical protein
MGKYMVLWEYVEVVINPDLCHEVMRDFLLQFFKIEWEVRQKIITKHF